MPFVLPNPTVPTNGQSLDATPVLQNFLAIAQAIQAFDGSQITAGSVVAAAMNASINPNTLLNETTYPFVRTGVVWSIVSALTGTMTGGTMYYNGIRVPVNSIASNAFAASKDTYVDVDVNGNVTYQAVTNNAASPSLTANSIRVAIVVTSGAAITSINQGSTAATAPVVATSVLSVSDSLGNLIYPSDPNGKLLGHRQLVANFNMTSTSPIFATGLGLAINVPASSVGRKISITGFTGSSSNTGGNYNAAYIFDGVIGSGGTQIAQSNSGNTAGFNYGNAIMSMITATAGLKILQFGASTTAGTGTFAASANNPMFLKAELD